MTRLDAPCDRRQAGPLVSGRTEPHGIRPILVVCLLLGLAIASWPSPSKANELISQASDGTPGNGFSAFSSISDDGRFVTFHSLATNLDAVDTNGVADVYVHDRMLGTNELVSVDSAGNQASMNSLGPVISGDGRFVAFDSFSADLVLNDTNGVSDIFVHDRVTGTTERVSVDSAGSQGIGGGSFGKSISEDGRFVTFESSSTFPSGGISSTDVYLRDRQLGSTVLVTVDSDEEPQVGGSALNSVVADGGRLVAFSSSSSSLVPNDLNFVSDVFVRDLLLGTTERISNAYDAPANAAAGASVLVDFTPDGRFVVFHSSASDVAPGDTNIGGVPGTFGIDIFVHDRTLGQTDLVSVASDGSGANGDSSLATITADGRYVVFDSAASNLVSDDMNFRSDIFLHDRVAGTTERLSLDDSGGDPNNNSFDPQIMPDGSFMSFHSGATDLLPTPQSNAHVYVTEAVPEPGPGLGLACGALTLMLVAAPRRIAGLDLCSSYFPSEKRA